MPARVLDKYLKVAGPIVITGLRGKHTEHNGMIGIAKRPVFVQGEWLARVKLEGERGSRGVRFNNLRRTAEPVEPAVHEEIMAPDAGMDTHVYDQQASAEGNHRKLHRRRSPWKLHRSFTVVSFDDCGQRVEVNRGDADMNSDAGVVLCAVQHKADRNLMKNGSSRFWHP